MIKKPIIKELKTASERFKYISLKETEKRGGSDGIGVLGWGVGGIEAEAAMLGQPLYMLQYIPMIMVY